MNLENINSTLLFIVSGILVTLSMLFSISESAFLSMNKIRLRILKNKKNKRAIRVSKLLEEKEKLINTLLVANDLVNILLSALITTFCLKTFGEGGVGYATLAVTILLLIFGEITPKTISTRNPDGIAYTLSLFVKIIVILLTPVVAVFTFFSRLVLRLKGINTTKINDSYTQDDIKSFIEQGSESGLIEKDDKRMLNRVFKFNDIEAQSIMVPRTFIIALKYNSTYKEVIELAQRTRLSKFPVYKSNMDEIVGVLYLRDLLKTSPESFNLKQSMRPPIFVPGTKKMSSVQQILRENNQSMCIVIDEYSGTDGLLTKDDISREIFATYRNGHKDLSSSLDINNKKSFYIDGSTLLLDLNDSLGLNLQSTINETIGGYIIEHLGRLSNPYDSITFGDYLFTVESVYQRRIKSVLVTRIES